MLILHLASVSCIPEPVLRPRDAGSAEATALADVTDAGGVDAVIPADAGSLDDAPTSDGTLDVPACIRGSALIDGRCTVIAASRPRWPPTFVVTTDQRPTFQWVLGDHADGARVELCSARACTSPGASFVARGSAARPDLPLAPGIVFWRVWSRRGDVEATTPSAVWSIRIPARSGVVSTFLREPVDVNGDGLADFVLGNLERRELAVYAGSRSTPPAPLLTRDPLLFNGGFELRHAGDVNGDGRSDVLVSTSTSSWRVYYGAERGLSSEFASITGVEPAPASSGTLHPIGDPNGDGFSDLAYTHAAGADRRGGVWVFAGSPSGISNTPSMRIEPTQVLSVSVLGDLDADGYEDVGAVGLERPGATELAAFSLLGATAGLSTRRLGAIALGMTDPFSLQGHHDFDGDTLPDAIVRGTFARAEVVAVLGVRGGLATTPIALNTLDRSSTADSVAADLDGDGRTDLVIPAYDARELAVHRGTPTGPAREPSHRIRLSATPAPPGLAAPGDMDGDGFCDLVAINTSGGRMSLYQIRGGAAAPEVAATPFDNVVTASSSALRPLE